MPSEADHDEKSRAVTVSAQSEDGPLIHAEDDLRNIACCCWAQNRLGYALYNAEMHEVCTATCLTCLSSL